MGRYAKKYFCQLAFLLLLACPVSSIAQEEQPVVTDTSVQVDEPARIDSPEESETDDDDPPINYFNRKSDGLAVDPRSLPPGELKKIRDDEDFWYANQEAKKRNEQQRARYESESGQRTERTKGETVIEEKENTSSDTAIGQQSWFQTFLWIVIVGVFVIGLVMYLGNSNVGLFRRKNKKTSVEGEEKETITEDIFAINYQKDIDRAAAQGNYRLATRLLFLRLLKTLSEKNIIKYKQDKTNLDYLMELHPGNYYSSFFRVTRNYEYSWYGQFNVSEEAYQIIRSDFDQFDKELKQA